MKWYEKKKKKKKERKQISTNFRVIIPRFWNTPKIKNPDYTRER